MLVLPDCRAASQAWELSAEQRQALVRLLAEKGPDHLEAWLRQEEKRDARLRARVQADLVRLEREARAERARRKAELDEQRKQALAPWERQLREQAQREQELRSRLATQGAHLPPGRLLDLSPALRQATAPPEPGFLARLWGLWVAFWVWLGTLWARLVRALRGKRGGGRTVNAGGQHVDILRLARQHPELFARLKLQGSRWRTMWERLMGREDYASQVQRLMDEEAAAARSATELEVRQGRQDLEDRLAELGKEQEAANRLRAEEEARLEAAQGRALSEMEDALRDAPYRRLRDEVLQEFRQAGLVDAKGGATHLLMERFSGLLAADELGNMPAGGVATPGSYAGGEGEYERGPLLSQHELGAIDLVQSLVQSRTRHPNVRHIHDDDAVVHREVRSTSAHVIVILDTSGSMEEHGRLDAAKRVALVLHRAVRVRRQDARVDLLQMETSVRRVDLAACWNAKPGGFTNFASALHQARVLLEREGADRQVVYLITDGLPEARTTTEGIDKADNPSACIPPAIEQAKLLPRNHPVRLVIYQLESRDPKFVEAARRIARQAGGRVEALEPRQLLQSLVVDLQAAVP